MQFIGLAGKADVDDMQSFVSNGGVDAFPHLVDVDGSIWSTFGVRSQPSFAFINDDGTMTVNTGRLGEDGLAERIAALQAQ